MYNKHVTTFLRDLVIFLLMCGCRRRAIYVRVLSVKISSKEEISSSEKERKKKKNSTARETSTIANGPQLWMVGSCRHSFRLHLANYRRFNRFMLKRPTVQFDRISKSECLFSKKKKKKKKQKRMGFLLLTINGPIDCPATTYLHSVW